MAIVKRIEKGSALTHSELDGNFTELEQQISNVSTGQDYDPTGETGENLQPNKITVQSALKEVRDWGNSPLSVLGDLVLPMEIDKTGVYNVKTLDSDLILTFSDEVNHRKGNTKILYLIGNGVYKFKVAAKDISVVFDNFNNGGILEDSVVHRFAFTYLGSYIDIDYAVKSIIEPDLTAPTLNSTSIEHTTDSKLNLTFSDSVSISTSGWTIATDGGALSILSVDSGNGTTNPKFLLSRSVLSTETVTISYDSTIGNTIKITNSMELASILNRDVTMTSSVVLIKDNFDDNSINTGIWDITTQEGATISEINQQLELSTTSVSDYFGLILKDGISSSNEVIIVQSKFNWSDSLYTVPLMGLTNSIGDHINEFAGFVRHMELPANRLRILIKDGGVAEENTNTNISSNTDVRIKYTPTTGDVIFQYWNGSSWITFGSTYNLDLGTLIRPVLYVKTDTTTAIKTIYDDFFISNEDYNTQYPV